MAYAENTSVSADRSMDQIRREINRFGASGFGFMEQADHALICFRFQGRNIKFKVELPDRNDARFHYTPSRHVRRTKQQAYKAWETECNRKWRCLLAVIKAKLVAVTDKVATFDEEFLPYIVLPDGSTVAERMVPQIEGMVENGTTPALALLPGKVE